MKLNNLKKLIEDELKQLSLENSSRITLGSTSNKPASISKPYLPKKKKDGGYNTQGKKLKKGSKWAKRKHYLKAFNENLIKKNNNETI
tara:strand:+ start:784 stop:1047 length:264 start_codon:yes stop_codon:yes gene_type:complete